MFQEMIEGVVYRPGLLLGLSESVEVVQDLVPRSSRSKSNCLRLPS